jgi:hypothetical protein
MYHIAVLCTYAIQFWQAVREINGCKLPPLHPATWTRNLLVLICARRRMQLSLFVGFCPYGQGGTREDMAEHVGALELR